MFLLMLKGVATRSCGLPVEVVLAEAVSVAVVELVEVEVEMQEVEEVEAVVDRNLYVQANLRSKNCDVMHSQT